MQSRRLLRRLRRFTKPWEAELRAKWLSRAASAIDHILSSGTAQDLFHFFYRNCGGDSPEAYHYNTYRFGMPGQFVALSFSRALPAQSGFVLDHSCGAGHLTWGLSEAVLPAQLIGQDISFFSLLAAKHFVVRNGWFVCTDIAKLPFRDGVFSTVMNSDAYTNFSAKLGAFEEMVRCSAPDASILLVWMRNKNRDHLYPNKGARSKLPTSTMPSKSGRQSPFHSGSKKATGRFRTGGITPTASSRPRKSRSIPSTGRTAPALRGANTSFSSLRRFMPKRTRI
jgi:hypothetical protein